MDDEPNSSEDDWMDTGAEYSPKSEFSKPKVVEEAVTRCISLRAKEMKAGYFNTNFSKDGLPIRQWIEDSRKSYCSSVQALKVLIMPEILTEQKKDSKNSRKKKQTKIFSKIKKIDDSFDKYAYYMLEQKNIDGKIKYIKTDECYMPEVDSKVHIRKIFPDGSEELVVINGYWNPRVNAYWDNLVVLNDQLLEQLMMVVHRLNYFKSTINF